MKLLAAVTVAAATLAGGVQTSDLRYTRMVEGAGGSHVSIEPDPAMFAHARVGFADVRVVDARGDQVPWRRLRPDEEVVNEPVPVLNSGTQGGVAVALLDLGPTRAIRDSLILEVPDHDFVGRAVVLGADRRQGPFTRLGATGIYDVRGARVARSTTAVFPATDHRFLLLRASGVTLITGATVAKEPEQARKVVRSPRDVSTRQLGRATVVTLDFGFRNVPVDELRISAATPRYDRRVVVETTDDPESGWSFVAGGRISRFEGSTTSPIQMAYGTRSRYVRVTIENGDDAPLERIEVRALSRSFALVLEGGHRAPYTVYYGARGARAPSYEFARLPVDDAIAGASLTPERRNPDFEAAGPTFGERNKWLVNAALAAAALAVGIAGLLALRRRA